jgi:hypothetical protein
MDRPATETIGYTIPAAPGAVRRPDAAAGEADKGGLEPIVHLILLRFVSLRSLREDVDLGREEHRPVVAAELRAGFGGLRGAHHAYLDEVLTAGAAEDGRTGH